MQKQRMSGQNQKTDKRIAWADHHHELHGSV